LEVRRGDPEEDVTACSDQFIFEAVRTATDLNLKTLEVEALRAKGETRRIMEQAQQMQTYYREKVQKLEAEIDRLKEQTSKRSYYRRY
jgi:hypothetical protein